jgi:signal transduction histidine kinase
MPRTRTPMTWFSGLHRVRRTLQMRLALLYGGLFLACGAALIAFAGVLFLGLRSTARSALPVGKRLSQGHLSSGPPSGNLHQVLIYSGLALAVLTVVSLPVGWQVAGRVLRPFRTIMTTARDISASNLRERLELDGPYDEFIELGGTLDDLFGRLEASFASQRRFVANASHELRTPLTVERTLLQVALADPDATAATFRATCEELLTLGDQQERLIEALLALASSEQGVEQWESYDLSEIAGNIVLSRRDEAEHQGIHIDATLAHARTVGDPNLVEILVANLVDNALRHNLANGQVGISTATVSGSARISVTNTGPVVRPQEINRIFQPFQRSGGERVRGADGHGLGLAIVHAIAMGHGAAISAHPGPQGGLNIEVTFPASNAPGPDYAIAAPLSDA